MTVALLVLALTSAASAGPPRPATEGEIAAMLAEAGDAEDYQGASIVDVLDEADVYVERSGLATTERCRVVKLLNDAAVRSWAVYRESYDPDTYRVTIRSIRIHRTDESVDDVPVTRIVCQPTAQRSIHWGGEQQLLPLPRLHVGDALEIRVSRIGFNIAYLADGDGAGVSAAWTSAAQAVPPVELEPPMPGQWYEVTEFQSGHPILNKRYSVHIPADMPLQYEVCNGALKTSLWMNDDRRIYTFEVEDVPPVKTEPHMVSRSDCVPKVVMATLPDWEMKSVWFYQVNEPQFDADEAIRAKVAELTDHLEDEEAKIAACLHWVADNIRYVGTSRGPCEGFTLHRGIETFRDRGGVCKDKAGMLVTMLRVLGHESYPALTMAGSRVEEVPADQFNHTVTVMRGEDGAFRLLDPTWSPLSRELWSSREALQGLVYGTPDGQDLTLSPYFPPEYNTLDVVSRCSIDSNGSLSARWRMDMTGYPCTYLRRTANRNRPDEPLGVFEDRLGLSPDARIISLDHIEPTDYSRDGWLEMTVESPGYAAAGPSRLLFRLPMMRHPLGDIFIPDLLYDFKLGERERTMRMRATRLVRYDETIELPDGWRAASVPEARSIDTPSASLSFDVSAESTAITYRFELALRDHHITPDAYSGVKRVIDAMHEISDAWIVCEPVQ
jgi:hypothetical protein